MTYAEERVAAEMGRLMLALYRAGFQVSVKPDPLGGRAEANIRSGPSSKKRAARLPSMTRAQGDSPLAAICAAIERMNQRAGAILVDV